MIWRCPCGTTFGDDAVAFRNHLKTCTPEGAAKAAKRREAAEAQDPHDAPLLTRYETRKLQEAQAKVGDAKAGEQTAALVKRRLKWERNADARKAAQKPAPATAAAVDDAPVDELLAQRGTGSTRDHDMPDDDKKGAA